MICEIRLQNFRNMGSCRLQCQGPEVFFIGENGQGKTNLLESIYFLCYGSSFRVREDSLLCKNGENFFTATAEFRNSEEDTNIVDISWKNGVKTIRLNGKSVSDRKDIIRNLPCIVFSHEDISFVNGSPEKRRLFLDQTLSLYNPFYIDLLRKYKKIVKTRNLLLKEKKKDLLSVYDDQFVELGMEIQKKRQDICSLFNPYFREMFRNISEIDETVELNYQSSWQGLQTKENVLDFLHRKLPSELIYGLSGSGPHRDRLFFSMKGQDFSNIGSTGQMRLVSLILRTIQAEFFTKTTGRKPLLLLDDVLLELDGEKRKKILKNLPSYEQAFFTFLPDEEYKNYNKENTMVFTVKGGVFTQSG